MHRKLIALFSVLALTAGVAFAGKSFTLRAASGALTVGETSTELGVGLVDQAVVTVNVTTLTVADGDDEVSFFLQTTYDGGATWVDIENVNYATGDTGTTPSIIFTVILSNTGAETVITPTDGTLADDTKLDLPLGDRIRIKTTVAGATAPTYAYNATLWLRTN